MIKASELRIGNCLSPRRTIEPQNNPLLGYSICAAHIAYSDEELNNDWEGIHLTPEILGKCGFEWYNVNGSEYHWSAELEQIQFVKSEEAAEGYCIFASGVNVATITVSYLHQLQNLFYCLTGQELEVKL